MAHGDIRTGTGNVDLLTGVTSENGAGRDLTDMQRMFAVHFATNGGHGPTAAKEAGAKSPNVQAAKWLAMPKVLDYVRFLSVARIDSLVPAAITALLEVMNDREASESARISAAKSILDRAGIIERKSPSVAIQINNEAGAPGSIIQRVYDSEQARLSDISDTMSDSDDTASAPQKSGG